MAAQSIIPRYGLAKRVNIFCLFFAFIVILILPFKKEIWYDETVSILCSKGISHDTHILLDTSTHINAGIIEGLNTSANVFKATVNDNANSFLYNYGLHCFTQLFGNDIGTYLLFSKLCAIAALLAFFLLCRQLLGNTIYVSVAVILLACDLGFVAMSHEIRAYAMAIFFVTLSALYLYKFLYASGKPLHLLFTGLFAVAAILSHFLVVYMIGAFLLALLYVKRSSLFTRNNILAMLLPLLLLAGFFWAAWSGMGVMGIQNKNIEDSHAGEVFNLSEVILRSLRYTAANFKVVLPAFINNIAVVIASFLFVMALYMGGLKAANNNIEKRNVHLLFIAGITSSLFLALLSIRSHHYTPLYYRYYSFGLPFSSLFVAYVLFVFSQRPGVHRYITGTVLVVVLVPTLLLMISGVRNENARQSYNHLAIANEIISGKIERVDVPGWREAFLVQSFLPAGYKIDYFRIPASSDFVLYKSGGIERIKVIKADH